MSIAGSSDAASLLPAMDTKQATGDFPGWRVRDHGGPPQPAWTTDELGCIKSSAGDAVSDARLACIAACGSDGWQVTQATIARARALGLTADQILGWLREHVAPPVPPLLEMAVRNWNGRETCRLARVHLLQVSRPQARDAILHSQAFAPLLAGHIPPDWFVLRDDSVVPARKLLKTLGFALSDTLQVSPLPTAFASDPPPPMTGKTKRSRRR